MTLQDRGMMLIDYLGQLSTCEDICCDCVAFTPEICECISGGDFPSGSVVPATLSITLPGDTAQCILSGVSPPCAPVDGVNFAGTYFLVCDDDAIAPSEKVEVLRQELTFICTRSGRDYYASEACEVRWQMVPGIPGVSAVVSVAFSTFEVAYTAGDDPDVDPPLFSSLSAGVRYTYHWIPPNYADECGSVHRGCSDLTLVSTFQETTGSIECSHSTADEDYKPTMVRIGTL